MTDNQRNHAVSLKEPPSPGRPPVELQQCIEEILRHTIASSVSGNFEVDIGLSKELCINLLNNDPSDPTVPLYKRVAMSIYQFISSGSILESDSGVAVVQEACSLKKEKEEFNYKLAMEKGREILYMLERVDFELHVQEPFFSYLKSGQKTIEGRCAVGHYNKIEMGASILVNKCLVLQVKDVRRYASFLEMLEAESLSKVLPGVESVEEGVQVYRNFYTEEKERANGVLAICVTRSIWQPYLSMAKLISGLSYEGLESLQNVARCSDQWLPTEM